VRCAHAPSLGGLRTLQVVRVRNDDGGELPVLVVEDYDADQVPALVVRETGDTGAATAAPFCCKLA
jgi:hypothetical protein